MSINYKEELNPSQCEAVMYNGGPSLVIAGAGSGKTRVLTYKIAFLLEQGYEPWNILALTFTNKAAREMKERITTKVGNKARYLWMGTFHSIFSRILRAEHQAIGFSSKFTIYDTSDSKSLIRSIIKEMGLDEKTYTPGSVQARISDAKNHLVPPSVYAMSKEAFERDAATKTPAVSDIYKRYANRCRQADAMDFDDLLFYTYVLFRDNPEVLAKYRQQFTYVLVDEYQDTNFAQHKIVEQLCKERQMLCVVGDDAQSIYSFRGAKIDNILSFSQQYPRARVFKLEQNYRSTQNIVSAANSLIEKNQRQIPKAVFSEKERGEAITVFQAYSDVEEPELVANKIAELRRQKEYEYSDFAILYRTNAQSRVFEEAFRRRGMPYKIYGGLSFYQRKEIKDVISYFRLVVNPNDEEAFKRIVNYPARGIGETTLKKIVAAAVAHQTSLWRVIDDPAAHQLDVNKGTLAKLQGFKLLIDQFIGMQQTATAYELGLEVVRRSGIGNEIVTDNSPENLSRKENIDELMNGMHNFCAERMEQGDTHIALADFLSEVALLTDQDAADDDQKKITLMTIHAAKGLEFRNVFVVGLEDGLFPSTRSLDSMHALEEERRLFYVAITRAEDYCFLSLAKNRQRYGRSEFAVPSRFLKDIDECYLNLPGENGNPRFAEDEGFAPWQRKSHAPAYKPKSSFSPPDNSRFKRVDASPSKAVATQSASSTQGILAIGQRIAHERFGVGEVVKMEGAGDNLKATIRFENAGEKQLLLRFARFKVLND